MRLESTDTIAVMLDNNNKNDTSSSDEDPTLELEPLNLDEHAAINDVNGAPVELPVAIENRDACIDSELVPVQNKAKTETDELRDELQFRLELNDILQLGNEQLRKQCEMLQQQVADLTVTIDSLNSEMNQTRGDVDSIRREQEDTIAQLRQENLDLNRHANELEKKLNTAILRADQRMSGSSESPSGQRQGDARIVADEFAQILVATDTSGKGPNSWVLDRPVITIGSCPDCDIHIASRFVSKQHARLRVTPQGCVVEDLKSTNGTYVNSRRIRKRTIQSGDEITIGKTGFWLDKRPIEPLATIQEEIDAN